MILNEIKSSYSTHNQLSSWDKLLFSSTRSFRLSATVHDPKAFYIKDINVSFELYLEKSKNPVYFIVSS